MPPITPGYISRSISRAQRLSVRFRERLRGMSLRAAQRGQGWPIPPSHLIYLVAGTEDVGWFLDSGAVAAQVLDEVLARNGIAIDRLGSILDFGCGVGRVIRHLSHLQGPQLYGTDYNPKLLSWCQRHLPFAQFYGNSLQRGAGFRAESFDLVYALSIFTHLTEPLQAYWIDELARILRPGGHLLLTVHGDSYLPSLSPAERDRFRAGELVVQRSERPGSNDCAAFHPPSYVRSTFARGLTVADFIAEGARGNPHQDVYLLRKP
ncbi:MAG TPA: class I SAM-dependent methyltransferase [Isosphaeraceae bacterium]|nr:class I SAM-dependent methyltransferase [Isosphaeraceae bacterium]